MTSLYRSSVRRDCVENDKDNKRGVGGASSYMHLVRGPANARVHYRRAHSHRTGHVLTQHVLTRGLLRTRGDTRDTQVRRVRGVHHRGHHHSHHRGTQVLSRGHGRDRGGTLQERVVEVSWLWAELIIWHLPQIRLRRTPPVFLPAFTRFYNIIHGICDHRVVQERSFCLCRDQPLLPAPCLEGVRGFWVP